MLYYSSVSDLERAGICEKYNDTKTKELIKISCYRCNSHVGIAVIFHNCAQGICHSSRFICSVMTSSATSRLRLDFHHIKVNFKKSEIVQALIYIRGGMVHRCHGSIRTLVWRSRFDTISVQQKKKRNLLCSCSFHLFWTGSSANYYFFPFRCKNTYYFYFT